MFRIEITSATLVRCSLITSMTTNLDSEVYIFPISVTGTIHVAKTTDHVIKE